MMLCVSDGYHQSLILGRGRLWTAPAAGYKDIQNLGDPGPIVYSFSEKPALRDFVNYNETHDDHLESRSHKEWRYWLNAGSTVKLSYDVRGFSQDYLVLAFIRGTEALEDWIRAPESRAKTINWYRIHGSGVKYLTADRDDDYFVAYGNLNSQDMEVRAQLMEGSFGCRSRLYEASGCRGVCCIGQTFGAR